MKRVLVAVSLLVVLAVPPAEAKPSPRQTLQRYTTRVGPEIQSYRSILMRFAKLLAAKPISNVDPLVAKLYGVADRFGALKGRWQSIRAPKGLRLRHDGMGRAFDLYERSIRIYAAALFTRHLDEIRAASIRLHDYLRSVAYLQKRWSAALRGALVRAEMKVPRWLDQMAKIEP
jgi:hypothetical protein